MGEVEGTNYRAGNGLTRRVQAAGEELEGVTLPSPFAAEMTEAEADELVNSQRALYQHALKRRETIVSNSGKKKCTNTLSGVPAPKKKPRAAKSGRQKAKQGKKAGATKGSQADLPAPATTEEELVTEALPDLPLPASFQQQQQAVTNPNPPPASFLQQLFTSSTALPEQQQHNLEFLANATTGALAEDLLTAARSAFDEELDDEVDQEDDEQDEDEEEDYEEDGAEQQQQQVVQQQQFAQQQQQAVVEQNGVVRGIRSEGECVLKTFDCCLIFQL
ncbi:unnamed protein product [Closterium sp. NIES-64]|nr:unnamed protein product [Closterium sp. NIES-64]